MNAIFLSRRGAMRSMAASAFGFTVARPLRAAPPQDGFVAAVLDLYADRHAASRVGEAYLASHREDSDVRRLVQELRAELRLGTPIPSTVTAQVLRASIRRRARSQARRGQLVRLENHVLSATEARLCALVHLVT